MPESNTVEVPRFPGELLRICYSDARRQTRGIVAQAISECSVERIGEVLRFELFEGVASTPITIVRCASPHGETAATGIT